MSNNAKMIEGAYAAFARADIPAVIDLTADDVVWSSPTTLPQGGEFHGKAGVGEFFQSIGGAWSDLTVTVESLSESDGQVVTVVNAKGTLRAGGKGAYGATHVFDIRDGKVARFREYTDLGAPLA
jgi:ketosteroid isomerase-like protein